MTTPWELYYHITVPATADQDGQGEQVWTVDRVEDAEWYVVRPNRGLVSLNLRNHLRTSRQAAANVQYVPNPEPDAQEKQATKAPARSPATATATAASTSSNNAILKHLSSLTALTLDLGNTRIIGVDAIGEGFKHLRSLTALT